MDTDLRWTLLQSLAAGGAVPDERLDEELRRDNTATGKRQQALALAARPTAAAKAAAWTAIVDDSNLPNALLDATLGGFAQPGQQDVLEPYRDRYFAALDGIWRDRTPEMAQSITTLLYPFLLVDEATVAAADAYLARAEINSSARRLVSEGRDATLRALRAQVFDAGDAAGT